MHSWLKDVQKAEANDYRLLPIASRLLLTAYRLSLIAYRLLPLPNSLAPTFLFAAAHQGQNLAAPGRTMQRHPKLPNWPILHRS